jgi:hypothetical protein
LNGQVGLAVAKSNNTCVGRWHSTTRRTHPGGMLLFTCQVRRDTQGIEQDNFSILRFSDFTD